MVVVVVVVVVVVDANWSCLSLESGPGSGLYRSRRVTKVVQEHCRISSARRTIDFTSSMQAKTNEAVNAVDPAAANGDCTILFLREIFAPSGAMD